MTDSRRLELKLESKVDSVDAAEFIVKGLGRDAGFAEDDLDHLGMAVRETVVNAVTHGNGYSSEKSVGLTVEVDGKGMRVTIRDEGEGFDPNLVPDPTQPENLLKASGRGLLMSHALVDEVEMRRAEPIGMEVVLVKHGPDKN